MQSVARALRLVGIVADGPGRGAQTLSELARALGTSKSTTLALARTLAAFGYLRDARPGPRYTLGTALIRLGDIVGRQLPLGDLCRPLIDELSEADQDDRADRGQRGGLPGVHRPGGRPGQRPLPHPARPARGARTPRRPGKAILSSHGRGARSAGSARRPGWRRAPRTPSPTSDTLLDNLAAARRLGFAVDDEEDAEGVICVGAAFFGHDGSCAGAVSVTGIKGDLPAWRIDELGRAVRGCADRVSALLGGAPAAGMPGCALSGRCPSPRCPGPRCRGPCVPGPAVGRRPGPAWRSCRPRMPWSCSPRACSGWSATQPGPRAGRGAGPARTRSGCAAPTWTSWPAGSTPPTSATRWCSGTSGAGRCWPPAPLAAEGAAHAGAGGRRRAGAGTRVVARASCPAGTARAAGPGRRTCAPPTTRWGSPATAPRPGTPRCPPRWCTRWPPP